MTESLENIAERIKSITQDESTKCSLLGCTLNKENLEKYISLLYDSEYIISKILGKDSSFLSHIKDAIAETSQFNPIQLGLQRIKGIIPVILSASRVIDNISEAQNIKTNDRIKHPYISPSRIYSLQNITDSGLDFTRLIELCRELNCAAENDCHMATAMLARAILDHIPPVFGSPTFSQFSNNYGGPKSNRTFKSQMQRLENGLRSVADTHLHTPIRKKETLPTEIQVNFATEIDVLLGEIIRRSQEKAAASEKR